MRFLAILAFLAALLSPGWARAQTAANGWQVCNQTSYIIEAAYGRPDGRAVLVQGWTRMRPGECRQLIAPPLARGVHYLHARTSTAHRGGRRQWGGAAALCVDPGATFAIQSPPRCKEMGLEERNFREVRIGRREGWRTVLSEPEPYSLARARAAGLQRLFADAGVEARGANTDPRRAAAAIAAFRQQARLPANASEEQLIDALEQQARRRAASVGLSLCNRTGAQIWTAIARRQSEGWESRGWWPIAPGACAKTIDAPLLQQVYFVHAVMSAKGGERYLSAAGETFCTARTRFAIMGRDGCERRLYDTAIFAAFSTRGREGITIEFNDRDFLPPGVAPKQANLRMSADAAEKDRGRTTRSMAPVGADEPLAPRDQKRQYKDPKLRGGTP